GPCKKVCHSAHDEVRAELFDADVTGVKNNKTGNSGKRHVQGEKHRRRKQHLAVLHTQKFAPPWSRFCGLWLMNYAGGVARHHVPDARANEGKCHGHAEHNSKAAERSIDQPQSYRWKQNRGAALNPAVITRSFAALSLRRA